MRRFARIFPSFKAALPAAALLTLASHAPALSQDITPPGYKLPPLGAVTAIAAAKDAPRGALVACLAVIALATLGNAGLAAYHAGVEWGFWQGPTACTGPVGNLGSAGNLLERLDTVKVVRCDEVQWKFLGLSLAGYDVLISLLMAAIAAWGAKRAARQ